MVKCVSNVLKYCMQMLVMCKNVINMETIAKIWLKWWNMLVVC